MYTYSKFESIFQQLTSCVGCKNRNASARTQVPVIVQLQPVKLRPRRLLTRNIALTMYPDLYPWRVGDGTGLCST